MLYPQVLASPRPYFTLIIIHHANARVTLLLKDGDSRFFRSHLLHKKFQPVNSVFIFFISPGWCVHKANVQKKWDDHTHNTHHRKSSKQEIRVGDSTRLLKHWRLTYSTKRAIVKCKRELHARRGGSRLQRKVPKTNTNANSATRYIALVEINI